MSEKFFLIGVLLLLVGCSSQEPRADQKQKFAVELCKSQLKPLSLSLETSLKKADLSQALVLFEKMERFAFEMWVDRIPRHEPENLTSFQEHGKKLQMLCGSGKKACKKSNLFEAKKNLERIKRSCQGCHSEYRFDF